MPPKKDFNYKEAYEILSKYNSREGSSARSKTVDDIKKSMMSSQLKLVSNQLHHPYHLKNG